MVDIISFTRANEVDANIIMYKLSPDSLVKDLLAAGAGPQLAELEASHWLIFPAVSAISDLTHASCSQPQS